MDRKKFIGITGGTIILIGTTSYLLSDKSNLVRADLKPTDDKNKTLKPDEKEILFLASLAPSGHNTQPWFIQYLEPYHWIIGNDKSKWIPAVDPTQRETILSIGAFMQNLEYAASSFGYTCDWNSIYLEIGLFKKLSKTSFTTPTR
jgi:nitroreductase